MYILGLYEDFRPLVLDSVLTLVNSMPEGAHFGHLGVDFKLLGVILGP